ncbi:unnamed protein product [Effrenium voratum]|nr:unnamed protein product [Effrenium voratum]
MASALSCEPCLQWRRWLDARGLTCFPSAAGTHANLFAGFAPPAEIEQLKKKHMNIAHCTQGISLALTSTCETQQDEGQGKLSSVEGLLGTSLAMTSATPGFNVRQDIDYYRLLRPAGFIIRQDMDCSDRVSTSETSRIHYQTRYGLLGPARARRPICLLRVFLSCPLRPAGILIRPKYDSLGLARRIRDKAPSRFFIRSNANRGPPCVEADRKDWQSADMEKEAWQSSCSF